MQYYKAHSKPGCLKDILGPWHREIGDIPGILKAQDVFVEEDGHLVIKNPSKPYRPAY